ncbi:MAG TPA: HD domain-containing protein [Egibacteraceae bacterium]|nr:HD domain-containing protein [Egibacteraceae bacterium]
MEEVPLVQPSQRFVDAVGFAAEIHRSQSRKGSRIPYVSYLLAVASLVLEDGGDENEAIAGLLHDTLEDSGQPMPAMIGRIRSAFGDRVGDLVEACTDVDVDRPAERSSADWRARKQHTIDALAKADRAAARVMLADKLHNLRSLPTDLELDGQSVWQRFNAGRDDQLWYYAGLAEAARERHPGGRLAHELVRSRREPPASRRSVNPAQVAALKPQPQDSVPLVWRLGLYEKPAAVVSGFDTPVEYGVVEHEFAYARPDDYRTVCGRFGHTAIQEGLEYTASAWARRVSLHAGGC